MQGFLFYSAEASLLRWEAKVTLLFKKNILVYGGVPATAVL
jgi:hypothetical protein